MNSTALATLLALLTQAGALEADAQAVITFVQNTIVAAENTSLSGADKLTAVLNATEAFLATELPKLEVDYAAVAKAVEAFVNDVVTIYNKVALFVHTVVFEAKTGLQAVESEADKILHGQV